MSSKDHAIVCFPGFLGKVADFELLASITPDLVSIDICGSDAPEKGCSWRTWNAQILEKLERKLAGQTAVLVGYSMGARIVHSLLEDSPKWLVGAVLLSCNPGLATGEEKISRRKSDAQWSERFLREPWQPLMDSWNAQDVLKTSNSLIRDENAFDRSTLARVLNVFSLANQQSENGLKIKIPSLLAWGQNDHKYRKLTEQLAQYFNQAQLQEVPNAGHRVVADQPGYVVEMIRSFLIRL